MHWLAVLLGATLATPALAEIKTNALFADHVVLQTTDDGGAGALVGGTATPGETVTLALAGAAAHSFTGVASATGAWVVAANLTSGGPYTMTLKGSKSTNVLTATDALVGDVYICSGQSNMVFAIGAGNPYRTHSGAHSIENATAEIAAAHYPDMRLWFVPSPAQKKPRAKRHHDEFSGPYEGGCAAAPQTNLTGGCNVSGMCTGSASDPQNWGCRDECHANDANLIHEWSPITPITVQPLSAVCYIAIRNINRAAHPSRPVGIIASYVGGTPVGCWASDPHADKTCGVTPSPEKNVPCNATTSCCPAMLFNAKIAPLLPFNVRAALWYQGEANTDEGYTRTRKEYACQMKLLIDTWRKAWGYALPFYWMQLHGWGKGGGASDSTCFWGGGPHVYDLDCTYAIRLAQDDVARLNMPFTGLASAVDGCEADANGSTCNLHPGWKTVPATRLGWEVENSLFGAKNPKRPIFSNASFVLGAGGKCVTVSFELEAEGSEGLVLQPIHNWKQIWGGLGCGGGVRAGMVVLNATLDGGAAKLINGSAAIVGGKFVGTWSSAFENDGGVVGKVVTAVHEVRYLPNNVPTCVVANAGGRPLSPLLHHW